MVTLNGVMFENYQERKRLDKFYSMITKTKNFGKIRLWNDKLFLQDNQNSLVVYDNFGSGNSIDKKEFNGNFISDFDLSEKNNNLIVANNQDIWFFKLDKENNQYFNNYQKFSSHFNDNIKCDCNFQIQKNLYYDNVESYIMSYYQRTISFLLDEENNYTVKYFDRKYFISSYSTILSVNETEREDLENIIFFVYENDRRRIHISKIDESEDVINHSFLFDKKSDVYNRDDDYINTINNIYTYRDLNNNVKLLVSFFNGNFYSLDYDIENKSFLNEKFLFNVEGNIEKVKITKKYIIVMHDLNELVLWNIEKNKREIIKLSNTPTDFDSNNLFVTVIEDENQIGFYKLENIPNIYFENWWIEKYQKENLDTYILNNFITLDHKYNIYDKTEYEIKLDYRNSCEVTKIFPETNQSRNLYMFLDKENILNEFKPNLYEDKLYYTITNKELDFQITNHGTEIKEEDLLPKIFIKDIYHFNNNTYFRFKFLYNNNYENNEAIIALLEINGRYLVFKSNNFNNIREEDISNINESFNYPEFIDVDNTYDNWIWMNIKNTNFDSICNINIIIDRFKLNEEDYELIDEITYENEYSSRQVTNDILYKNTDGDIKMIEEEFILENKDKTNFLEKFADPIYEKEVNELNINKTAYIGNYPNSERTFGQLDLTTNYPYGFKEDSIISNIFINGKKVFMKYYKQFDDLQGVIYSFLPVRLLKEYVSEDDYESIKKNEKFIEDNEILLNGYRKKLINSERIIVKHTVDNTFEDETSLLNTYGLYITAKIPKEILSNNIRVYIKLKSWIYFRRLNPVNYKMTIDYDYNQIKLVINGANYCKEGTEIFLVTNGITSGLQFFTDFDNTPYDIECIPLLETDEEDNIYTNSIYEPEDLEIIINGLTLYPKVDYDIVNLSDETIPTLIVFRNVIPKSSKIEINYLDEGNNYIRYFKKSSENGEDLILDEEKDLNNWETNTNINFNNIYNKQNHSNILNIKTKYVYERIYKKISNLEKNTDYIFKFSLTNLLAFKYMDSDYSNISDMIRIIPGKSEYENILKNSSKSILSIEELLGYGEAYPYELNDSKKYEIKFNTGENTEIFIIFPFNYINDYTNVSFNFSNFEILKDNNYIISLNNDNNLFIPESFNIYLNNLKIKNSDVEILNTNSLRIKNHNQEDIKNIMIRFSYEDHTHLKEIFDKYKYDNIDFNDENYHSYFSNREQSEFDKLCNNIETSSIRKLMIKNNLIEKKFNIFDCNDRNSVSIFDIILDGKSFNNIYCNGDIVIDCNPINL